MSVETLIEKVKIDSKQLAPCQERIEFVFPKETLLSECAELAGEFSKIAAVPGFRKGKAPLAMVKKRFADQIAEELQKRVVSGAFSKIAEDKSKDMISYALDKGGIPKIDVDSDYKLAMIFDFAPDFQLPDYKGMKVEIEEAELSDKDIDDKLAEFRNMYAEYKDAEGEAAAGDMLKIDYESDLTLPEDASAAFKRQVSAKDSWLWLSEPEMIPGAIKELTGATAGAEYDFESDYADDYHVPELAGKKVKYHVKVNAVQRRVPLAGNEELCEKMRVKSIDELREIVVENAKRESDGRKQQQVREKLYELLDKKVKEFALPPGVMGKEVEKELRQIAGTQVKTAEDAEKFKKDIEKHRKQAEEKAAEKLRRMFILRRIAANESLELDRKEVDRQMSAMSRYYGYKEKEFQQMMERSGGFEDLQMDMLGAKALDFLAEHAKVESKAGKKTAAGEKKKA